MKLENKKTKYAKEYYLATKEVQKARSKKWSTDNPEKKKIQRKKYLGKYEEYNKKYRENHREFSKNYAATRRKENPDKITAHSIKKYGITMEEYNKKLLEQDSKCAICKLGETMLVKSTGIPRRLAVDHNHETGKVRDLLCHACNTAYGNLLESEENILSLLTYHRKHAKVDV